MWKGRTVSLILPTYNERESIRAAIEDFLATGRRAAGAGDGGSGRRDPGLERVGALPVNPEAYFRTCL